MNIPGLTAEVEVLIDRWGVPHIYAANEHDLFLAQGFVAARERLQQMDLWRRKGLGLLSEVFGPSFAEQDRAARLFLYRGEPDWDAYGPSTRRSAEAFVAGINAFIDLGKVPGAGRWNAEDIIRIRTNAFYPNVDQEVARAVTLAKYGPEVEDLRRFRTEGHRIVVPDGLDPAEIPEDVLRVYRLAFGPVAGGGSNNWVIGASRTRSGRPILANDPHRAMTVPSLRFVTHLVAPGIDVIGAGEPSLPGISVGHNGSIAFGLTIFAMDQEDLYVYDTDEWDEPERITELVPISGEEPREVELAYTRHGPVLKEGDGKAFALRAAWLEPGMAPYLGGVQLMRAKDTRTFRATLKSWGAPAENQVYATPDGEIGWQAAGLLPVRRGWDGTLPVPGDGRYEWDGFRSTDLLPGVVNPPEDLIVTANEQNFPDGERAGIPVGYDYWLSPQRAERIREVLTTGDDWTVADSLALQADELSPLAREVVPILLDAVDSTEPMVRRALQLLRSWDFVESVDAAAPAVFQTWFRRHLRPALLMDALAPHAGAHPLDEVVEAVLPEEGYGGDPRIDLRLLHAHPSLKPLMQRTFADAVAELVTDHGSCPESWQWGDLHTLTFGAPGLPPIPRGGSGDTVNSTPFDRSFRQVLGASFRIVIDVGDWDSSVAVNAPGQSEHPTGTHYDDHIDAWARGDAFPLSYSRQAVERVAESRLVLRPVTNGRSVWS
ncbi:penicillin acylase family protein [Lentzea alba]|uniref:penicillin acylase family protein n=1 Tax=Lentzea alba TaxID=2714351 RepID=UPI0039BFCA2C